ncbi:CMGC/DYRK protein kinase [Aphanomyces invadans]|uniref:CMGC/DYRK protein kinase n=1 Tax=Aphanomyces invadans TaxID=157072 RepID=A0A024T9K9_9STRA|nr:CMGC/DYRK protein kinase [Aphanomyces invadans]ETV90689.1 CMGC/DYRK protein kinase [Aphanomyces invadans]RHY27799.1 hypothetical protein DYB32_006518 [Aphanomyces invadans]|eukprot:XP_008880686.1 CMGC/DYRK protein kinase [Aphanomyces invadans]
MRIVQAAATKNEAASVSSTEIPCAQYDDGDDEETDPKSLASLLERILQKVSRLPGALEMLSSDPQLLHDLQEHEFLIYPTPSHPTSPNATGPHRRSLSTSRQSDSDSQMSNKDDDDLTESVDLTSERFGSEYEAELLAVESLQRGKSMNMVIPKGGSSSLARQPSTSSLLKGTGGAGFAESTSPSYSMGMLSISPGASSQDGDPVSAVWPRRPNEFAFSQPDETKDDELYNEVLFSELGEDDDDDDGKVFDMDDLPSSSHENVQDQDDDDDVEYETMRLRIIRERHRTGFEPSQEFDPEPGSLIGGLYTVEALLGEAVFSRTYKATNSRTHATVCLKIIRNSKEYFDQGIDEIRLLETLNAAGDVDEHHVLRLLDSFYFKEHLVLVTELLKDNLYEFSRQVRHQQASYFTMPRLKKIAVECLEALHFLHALNIVHCDLKPENIVMKSYQKCQIKLIDFGSASYVTDELTYYIQSRAYRAPEVILGLQYDERIDLWSLGCILAELYSGRVLFQHDSIPTLLASIISVVGNIPPTMLATSPDASKYFTPDHSLYTTDPETLQPRVVLPAPMSLWHALHCADADFIGFLHGLLQIDPTRRATAAVALKHPWLESNVYGISDFSSS